MLDDVPTRVWLLFLIAALAYPATRYVVRYFRDSPARRDITQPQADSSWRTPTKLAASVVSLATLAGLAFYIFTPSAEEFARSPKFLPILIGALGSWAAYRTVMGFVSGSIEPLMRGSVGPYRRGEEPYRYWLSMLWNAAMSGILLWVALVPSSSWASHEDANRCFDDSQRYSAQDELAACNKLIDDRDGSYDHADLLTARGVAYYDLGNNERALADYTEAIRLKPRDPLPHYNRGFVFQRMGDASDAVEDFSAAIRLRPDDAWAYYYRGWAYKNLGDESRASADFATALRLDPKLANEFEGNSGSNTAP